MSREERRRSIVRAARTVMLRKGIAATTARDVAAELGTSSGLLHHYVDSMDDLLAEAFAGAAEEDLAATRRAVESGGTALERLRILVDSYGRGAPDAGMQLWLDAWAEAARRPALQQVSQHLNEEWQRLLRAIIAEGVDAGSMVAEDADGSAWRLLSLLDGLALQCVAHPDAVSPSEARRWSRRAAERELGLAAMALG